MLRRNQLVTGLSRFECVIEDALHWPQRLHEFELLALGTIAVDQPPAIRSAFSDAVAVGPHIETPEGVCRPHAWPEPLAWLTEWDYPGNPYRGSATMKR